MQTIKLKRGPKSRINVVGLAHGEIAICMDTGEIFVGLEDGSKRKLSDVFVGNSEPENPLSNQIFVDTRDNKIKRFDTNSNSFIELSKVEFIDDNAPYSSTKTYSIDKLLNLFNLKADKSSVYDKGQVDSLLATKLNTNLKGVPSGLAELSSGGTIPLSQLPPEAKLREIEVVQTISERDSLGKFKGLRVHVIDDGTGSFAEYLYDGTQFIKTADENTLSVTQDWSDLKNKPTSTVQQIDNSVQNSHVHANKNDILDKLGKNLNGKLTFEGIDVSETEIDDFDTSTSKTYSSSKILDLLDDIVLDGGDF